MIFLTVGTYPMPFDRLILVVDNAVKEGLFKEEVFAQIGCCTYKPQHMKYAEMLNKDVFDKYFQKASAVVSHAGIGAIVMALNRTKPLLAMPRLKKYGEVVNNHQVATARKFEQLGYILAAYSEEELLDKLHQLKTFVPKPRENQAKAVAERIAKFLELLGRKKIFD